MDILQDVLVTAIAAGAAGLIVWRVATAGKTDDSRETPCASCPSSKPPASAWQSGAARRD